MNDKNLKKQSKLLALILRHKPEVAGLTLGKGGWVKISDLINGLSSMGKPISRSRLKEIVALNDKNRFAVDELRDFIRASQGHSVPIDLNLDPREPPSILYHGTTTKYVSDVMTNGLSSMNRNHVHLSVDIETATNVGSRHGKPVILSISTNKMYSDGYEFYLSDNGVWLTNEVPSKYIEVYSW